MSEPADQLPRTAAVIERGRANGWHSGAQIYVSRDREPTVDAAFGELSPDSIPLWLSSGKPLASVMFALFWEAGLIGLDDPVVKFIPDFAARGKERLTLRHLLTHTAGFRWVEWSPSWDETIVRICQAPIEPRWIPGRTAGYHPFTTWYVLGEIFRRVDPAHRPYERLIAEEIFQHAGMKDCFLAMTPQQFRDLSGRIAPMRVTNHSKDSPPTFATEAGCEVCSPGASARGPARELAKFYEMLLDGGRDLISRQTVEALTARHRAGVYDLTFKAIIDWGLGFIIDSKQYGNDAPYGFGPHASPRTFGHSGNQSSVAFADPEIGLVAVVIFNGMPGEAAHQQRMRETLAAIYEDLGISS